MAGALADTLFYQGYGAGARLIQQAINDVSGEGRSIAEDGRMGPGTFNAYRTLANDGASRSALLDALYQSRVPLVGSEE